ncbi:TAT-variant-translocated molybdopterin oxidoreductase [Bacteroidetes bacterium endosymbiont of Geopemphigus sp.]|uniref:TAT-variant-translocated molybdopterin oxidoreductase n=1 Tax=Bacteroidetes bacterium endosymbiont of Geopemphigus sp. TaxID=2047937 RepID=UPI000CD0F0D4|nr:TAT-variant-translocated molybdopterin oxidoreductase [Bacteroidetes bacterium endosymbiont of Geopemphigus sp.]
MDSKRKYWRGLPELQNENLREELAGKEFPQEIPVEVFLSNQKKLEAEKTTRRDFLKWMGFGTAAVALAACKGPVIRSIPYVVKPDSITPGIPNYYASTMFDGFDLASVLVKTREGRPIKIESNTIAPYFQSISARIQASLLSLYDDERLKGPAIKGKSVSWDTLDEYVTERLKKVHESGRQIVLLCSSFPSPSTKKLFWNFSQIYPTARLVTYDAYSYSYALEATEEILGTRALPYYELSKTELIVSFDADFLGHWSPESLEKVYAKRKKPASDMLTHIQIESNMSLTGANADTRIPLKPSQVRKMLAEVYKALNGGSTNTRAQKIAQAIKDKGSKAVVFADGSKEAYALALLINKQIQSGSLKKDRFLLAKESDDKAFERFIKDLKEDHIGAVLVNDTNPLYSFSAAEELREALKKIKLTVSFAIKEDETSEVMKVWAPKHHWLESWGDAYPITGMYTLTQPVIQPIFNTRQLQDSLLTWSKPGEGNLSFDRESLLSCYDNCNGKIPTYYDFLRSFWERNILPKANVSSFNKSLFDGFVEIPENPELNTLAIDESPYLRGLINTSEKKDLELRLYTKTAIGDGVQANNPWLQELPDPITRTTWENYVTLSSADAKNLGIRNWHIGDGAMNGNCVNLKMGNINLEKIPVYIQPGQALGSIGLALGYGREKGKAALQASGVNAYKLYKNFNIFQEGIQLEKSEEIHKFSCIQLQHTLVGRTSIARETDLETFLTQPKKVWNEEEKIGTYKGKIPSNKVTLWKEKDRTQGHHFNLSVDLNACTGCGSCIIACHAENNVPVVGKDEIRKSRDMHWLRIDRYYSTEESFESLEEKGLSQKNMFSEPEMYTHLLEPETNPQVIFQPVMCQHCNNAPCETVCPVAATSHGGQGQNMMAYNRCVGTRYCANNCPYKVRRFNWFNYAENDKFDFYMNNDLGRMVLNPDVVIRSRGVMEKCSLCIQMTQATVLKAKKERRKVKDEEFQTACTKACPTEALSFGDINDQESQITQKLKEDRSYKLLDFIGTRPNVFYQVKVRHSKKI